MFRRSIACIGLLGLVAATPALANKGSCASPDQVKAAQLRQLHYQLQVAALNCRGDYPDMPGKWETYIHRHGSTLSANARTMQGYFKSAAAFDRYNTKITNRESVRVHETHEYCEQSHPIFDKVVTLAAPQLIAYAGEVVGAPMEISACPTKTEKKPKKSAS
jgi:hypothetical protein